MTLKEYMLLRHPCGNIKALTNKECQVLGFELKHGWFKKYQDINIDSKLNSLSKVCPERIKAKLLEFSKKYDFNIEYLYIMENQQKLLKLGISEDPNKESIKLSHKCGCLINVKKIYKTKLLSYEVKKLLNNYFANNKLFGNWFCALTIEQIEAKLKELCSFEVIESL